MKRILKLWKELIPMPRCMVLEAISLPRFPQRSCKEVKISSLEDCRGHVVYHCPEEGFVINGDVLFSGSFGRVDLPGGDLETLKRSIFETMFALPEETVVYCGHGPETTIGQEKRFNYIHNF